MLVPVATAYSLPQSYKIPVLMEVSCGSDSPYRSSGASLTYAHTTIVVLCAPGTEHEYFALVWVGSEMTYKATAFAGGHHSSWSGKFGVNECGVLTDNGVSLAHSDTGAGWTLIGCEEP